MSEVKTRMPFRQGDVGLFYADLPEGELKPASLVLRAGKVTGHNHRLTGGKVFADADGRLFVQVEDQPVNLVHDEHPTIVIPPGTYRVQLQREHVPGELPRNVED